MVRFLLVFGKALDSGMLTFFSGCARARSAEKHKTNKRNSRIGIRAENFGWTKNQSCIWGILIAFYLNSSRISRRSFFFFVGWANKFVKFLSDSLLNELGKNLARLFDKFAGNKGNDLWPVVIDYQIKSAGKEMGKQII